MTTDNAKINSYDTAEELFSSCAREVTAYIKDCISKRGKCSIVLAGGSTPEQLYQNLSTASAAEQPDWTACQFYFGDERWVPHDHADSNYAMAMRVLFSHIDIPEENIHPIPTHCQTADECAADYETGIRHIDKFDLVLLGIGTDGHTASLFPGTTILDVTDKRVAAVFVDKLNTWRISLTYRSLNSARRVMILVQGKSKASIIKKVMQSDNQQNYPVSRLSPSGDLIWCMDSAALSLIEP